MPTFENSKWSLGHAPAAAGQTTLNGTSCDMAGYEEVTAVISLGAITATGTVTVTLEDSADNSSFAAITGASVAAADDDDNKLLILGTFRPRRYVRSVIARATADSVINLGLLCRTGGKEVGAGQTYAAGIVTNPTMLQSGDSAADPKIVIPQA